MTSLISNEPVGLLVPEIIEPGVFPVLGQVSDMTICNDVDNEEIFLIACDKLSRRNSNILYVLFFDIDNSRTWKEVFRFEFETCFGSKYVSYKNNNIPIIVKRNESKLLLFPVLCGTWKLFVFDLKMKIELGRSNIFQKSELKGQIISTAHINLEHPKLQDRLQDYFVIIFHSGGGKKNSLLVRFFNLESLEYEDSLDYYVPRKVICSSSVLNEYLYVVVKDCIPSRYDRIRNKFINSKSNFSLERLNFVNRQWETIIENLDIHEFEEFGSICSYKDRYLVFFLGFSTEDCNEWEKYMYSGCISWLSIFDTNLIGTKNIDGKMKTFDVRPERIFDFVVKKEVVLAGEYLYSIEEEDDWDKVNYYGKMFRLDLKKCSIIWSDDDLKERIGFLKNKIMECMEDSEDTKTCILSAREISLSQNSRKLYCFHFMMM